MTSAPVEPVPVPRAQGPHGRRLPDAFAGAFSGAMLAGAYAFEFIGGLAPCQMCHWQRWTHWAVIAAALLALALPRVAALRWLVAAALGSAVTIAAFHAGVEYGWWSGPASCAAGVVDPGELRAANPLDLFDAPIEVPDCSKPAWTMMGVSMAGWNALASLGALLLYTWLARRTGDPA